MKKNILIIIILIFIFVTASFFIQKASNTKKVFRINGHHLVVDIADNDKSRSQGLSGRVSMAPNEGMIFIFPTAGFYRFWMKEMIFPLDFIWINDKKVVDITQNVPTPTSNDLSTLNTFTSKIPFDKVIEVNSGIIKSFNIKPGDIMSY